LESVLITAAFGYVGLIGGVGVMEAVNFFMMCVLCCVKKIPGTACTDGVHGRGRFIFFGLRTEFVVAGRAFVG
ncbi:hypothetical protein, partial [Alistipes ihumii]|uniref:hypothetical protein n=1 Tax=Alistipes ihumii TaxID=1470347 RepID=UPI003AF1A0CC